jgi:hypothetical protein
VEAVLGEVSGEDVPDALVLLLLRLLHLRTAHCKENPIYVFLSWELRSLSPIFHIHVSVSDLYIPRIGSHISLQQNRQTDPGNILISLTDT